MKYYSAIVAIALLLMAAPFALAANGDGVVVSYKPNVVSNGTNVVLQIKMTNDATDGRCIDEILIMPPDTWGGTATVTQYSRSSFTATNQESNDDVNLVADPQSVRIVPDNMLCVGETVDIEVSGLVAPNSYEVSNITIKTSDQMSNSGPSQVYKTIDTPIPGTNPPSALPKVYVTKGTQLEIEYFHIESFTGTGTKGFTARAWGAWAALDKLYLQASSSGPITITEDAPNGPVTIFTGSVTAGTNTLTMDYSAWAGINNNADVKYGYLRDQAGARAFHITYGGASLILLGSTDKTLQDDDYGPSGLTGAMGTIITAGGSEKRIVLVNLVDDKGYDINEQIPIQGSTDLGSLEVAPYMTDTTGNAYFTLGPGCTYGIAHVNISTDPLKTTPFVVENVGIDSNVPASFSVVDGDGAYVPAGQSQLIKVEVRDSCGNLVSNTHQQLVNFDYLSGCGSTNKLSQVPGGISHVHENEDTDMGAAEVYLNTGCELCTHNVQVTVPTLPGSPKTIQLFGVNGPPVKMTVTADKHDIKADECVQATVEVTDACGNLVSQIPSEVGNEMEQWESIVRVTINKSLEVNQPGWTDHSQTWISDADFREQNIYNGEEKPYVQGKLNGGIGHVTVCGCQGLGQYDIVAQSDTIESGKDTVNVKNSDFDCIETSTVQQMLQCEKDANISVAIKDTCGNYMTNQACGAGGTAQYCVDLGLTGQCSEDAAQLSTDTVCINIGNGGPGYLKIPAQLQRLTSDCCQLQITASKGAGCCGNFPALRQCDDTTVQFHGAPDHMTTQFFKTRKVCEPGCPVGITCTDEFDKDGKPVKCHETLEGEISGTEDHAASETVSEEVLDLFTVVDKCGHIVKDYNGTVDVKLSGEDTASIYEVDHTLNLTGGWCSGTVQCGELTPFGQAKCAETSKCSWVTDGACSGTPSCADIGAHFGGQSACVTWGCNWDTHTNLCSGVPAPGKACDNTPPVPGSSFTQRTCEEVQCTWVDLSKCTGDATQGNCAPYTKDQCQEIGAVDSVENGCVWNDVACKIEDKPIIKKLVIHNTKPATDKQWLPIEKDDIVVDKLAFQVNHEVDPAGLTLNVYKESGKTPGFQPSQDMQVGKAPVNFSGPTIMELKDSDFSDAWDNQREGGVIIKAGDSRDFYVVLKQEGRGNISCGTYDAQFLWFQDYNSPDLVNSGSGNPDQNGDGIVDWVPLSGSVEDGCINSDNFNWIDGPFKGGDGTCPGKAADSPFKRGDSRNDDYKYTTPDYGFGDKMLNGLTFDGGQAWMKFRDLVAEHVDVTTSDVAQAGEVCQYSGDLPVVPNPEQIVFKEQPATQIKLINHDAGAEGKTTVCGQDEMDPESNAYSLNIQTTDGFDNPHGKEVQVDLEYCLKMPFGSWMGESQLTNEYLGSDQCFTKEQLKDMIKNSDMGQYMGGTFFGDFFGPEFSAWVDQYFEEAKVEFWDSTGSHKLPYDESGHQFVMTDSDGQAQVYVTSQKAGFYKIIARPLALDAASTYVEFDAGIPSKLDLVALPSSGIPADGEQEAMLLLRALDNCGNIVHDDVSDVTVAVTQGKQVYISQDFEGKNNYDGDVTGTVSGFGWTKLAVLSDLPQTATLTASAYGLESDDTQIQFQGAPVKLKVTAITPSDRLPADGETGAWVTVEVQDVNGNRVTGYHGNGYSGDPGDPWGCMNYEFKDICLDLDAIDGSFKAIDANDQYTYGWTNLHEEGHGKVCGDLMFGKGSVYVTYGHEGCTTSAKVKVTVFDEGKNGQEYNENGIPVSVKTTTLTPDSGEINYVQPATQWDVMADKTIALADGKSAVTLTVQVENPFMDIRQAVDGTVYVGGLAESGATISWEGQTDSLNPTKANIVTDPVTGRAYLTLTSTKAGKAEVTITGGKAYVCEKKRDDGYVCPTCKTIYDMYDCRYDKDASLQPKTIEVEFLEVASKDLYLEKGWNFVSVPYELNTSKDQVNEIFNLSNIIVAYGWNSQTQSWVTLTSGSQIKPLEGYWIKTKAPEVESLKYANPAFPSIPTKQVYSGWNAVGLTWDSPIKVKNALMSVNNVYTNLIGWVSSLQHFGLPVANTDGNGPFESGGVDMEPKQGYWVWSTGSGTLAGVAAQGAQ